MLDNNIYAVFTWYKQNNVKYMYHPDRHDCIYHLMMAITDGDHEISADAESWCELASVGEVYEFREGNIKIVELG